MFPQQTPLIQKTEAPEVVSLSGGDENNLKDDIQTTAPQDSFSDLPTESQTASEESNELFGFETNPDLFQAKDSSPKLETSEPEAPLSTPSLAMEDEIASLDAGDAEKRRRPTSLFERFTGVSRAKTLQPQPEIAKVAEQDSHEELDMLEIPAFLRRGS